MADNRGRMASSSTLLSQINSDFLTCLICMDTYKKPKVLNCQHSFCQECLESCETSECGSYMSCPVCRQRTLLGMKGVNGLKDNFVFSNLIEMVETWNKSKSPRHKSCESLEGDVMCCTCPSTSPTMATFQCLDCLDHLCADCAAFHSRAKLTKDHKVVPVEEIETGMHEDKIRLLEMSRCVEHEIEMKHFCDDCDVAVCKDCIIDYHQSHSLSPIEEAQEQKREKVSKIKSDLEASVQQLEELITEVSATKKQEKQKFRQKKKEVNEKAEELIEAIKKRQSDLIEEVEKVQNGNVDKIKSCNEGLETQLKCVNNCLQFSNQLLEDDGSFEILTMHHQIRDIVKELGTKTEEVLSRNKDIMETRKDIEIMFDDPDNICQSFGSLANEKQPDESEDGKQFDTETKPLHDADEKPSPKPIPTPAPRRHTAPESENRLRHPRPISTVPVSPLIAELQNSENFSSMTAPRKNKPRPLKRQNSDQNLSRSVESLESVGRISPARLAPGPPKSPEPDSQKPSDVLKKGKAPRPPALKPPTRPPLPPPQNKKPALQKTKILPLKATRLVKFGKRGKILTNGEFMGPPKCIKFSQNKKKILVLDAENRHILIFSIEGFFKKSFNVAIPDQGAYVGKTKIVQSKPVEFAEAGSTHVLILFKTFIVQWGWEGTMEHMWGSTDLTDANSITTDPQGRVLVSDQEKHMIFVYDRYTREKTMQFGGFGDRDNLFKSPRHICTNQYANIVVSDHHNHCVKVFDKEGRFIFKFGTKGTTDGQLKYPEGVTIIKLDDGSDGILVADEGNCRVSLFTSEGKFLSHVLTQSEDKTLKGPQYVSVSCTGEEIAVRQINNMQVKVYKLNKVEV